MLNILIKGKDCPNDNVNKVSTFSHTSKEITLFSSICGTLTRVEHMLGHKNLTLFPKT